MRGTGFASYWPLVVEGFEAFVEDGALSRGAAIAFYAVTAIAPTLFVTVMVASLGFGRKEASQAAIHYFSRLMGRESLEMLTLAIRNAPGTSNGLLGGIIGVATLVLTTSGVFGEIEDALNVIWRAPSKGSLLLRLLRGRAVSLGLVVGLGFLLLISMVFTATIAALGHYIDENTPLSALALGIANLAISTGLMWLLFAAIYKIVPNKDLAWRDVTVGAIGTAILFQLGQFLLGYYFGTTSLATPYGAAGGLIVMLLWAYYSAQVFLLGAEFTKVYARHFGSQQDGVRQPQPAGAVIPG